MKKALEIHDSTISEIKKNDLSIILFLGKGIMHHSEGEPGIDKGTCWLQSIEIYLENARIINEPDDIPNELDFGYFIINGTKYDNMIKVPFKESGDIEVILETFFGNELRINAGKITISEIDSPQYLQDFE
jgi:hypothetical protein